MKQITITFLTKNGEAAYHKTVGAGNKESFKNKIVMNRIATDKIIDENPLTVQIDIKIPWLADKAGFDGLIRAALENYGVKEGRDFKIKVS